METHFDQANGHPVWLRMRKPADMHQHLRQGDMLKLVAPMIAERFAMAIIMPNTTPFITTADMAADYRRHVRDAVGERSFKPLMTLYLTDRLEADQVRFGFEEGVLHGIKYYPRGLTTNSDGGVEDPSSLWSRGTAPYECLRELANQEGVFLIHAADGVASAAWHSDGRHYAKGDELDAWDQERHFIENTLSRIIEAHPGLKISVEHMSTAWGVEFLREHGGSKLGCSLTAHHLLLDRRDLMRGGFRPHRSWMPVIQPLEHTQELRAFAKEGRSFVWLGSDSAPHPRSKKEAACCASGVLMAHAAIELYAEAFEAMDALENLERFASIFGPRFFGLEPSTEMIRLVREDWRAKPLFHSVGDGSGPSEIVPFRSYPDDPPIRWKLAS